VDMCSKLGYLSTLTTANVDIYNDQVGIILPILNFPKIRFTGKKCDRNIYTNLKIEFDPFDIVAI